MAVLELSPPVFAILGRLVEEQVGLHYGLLDRDLLQEKASARALEAGFETLLDYYYYLRYDPGGGEELTQLIETLVVNETYFFREWQAIEALVSAFIEPACREGRRPRIWSAACATGEEPLSLAMLLDSRGLLDQVELVASDISERALAKAQSGRFGKRSLRQVPAPALVERYLRAEGDIFTVAPELIKRIHWAKHNLVESEGYAQFRGFDAVLCRNVLIYFADATVRQVLDQLHQSLVDSGVLLVGVSESLLRYGSSYCAEERHGAFVYRKVAR
jgi:chemotaxis protein methyltransferase CheR